MKNVHLRRAADPRLVVDAQDHLRPLRHAHLAGADGGTGADRFAGTIDQLTLQQIHHASAAQSALSTAGVERMTTPREHVG
jgi:hypothetical protein